MRWPGAAIPDRSSAAARSLRVRCLPSLSAVVITAWLRRRSAASTPSWRS